MLDPPEAPRAVVGAGRPRDRYGRPLRRGDDPLTAYPSVPERSFISGIDAWHEAISYLAQDLPFHAHEVFEQRWRCAPASERDTWRALAQWGAALTHAARGNTVGARRLAQRASDGLSSASPIDTIDHGYVAASMRDLLSA